jgi:asparagine synthase (glutamine-hydrolysing)
MCGIGALAYRGPDEDAHGRLREMARTMAHRGPDDEGVEVVRDGDLAVGLCTRRLAIQDCSPLGHQPMVSPVTGNVLSFNGEVYNVAELRAELEARGRTFRGHSDTEAVLYAFDEWGDDFLHRLRGMFGLAVWDARGRRLLFARDRLGIKPLYYSHSPSRFVLGSELRVVLASGLVDDAVSHDGIASFLALGAVREPLTALRDVAALAPGHVGELREGRLTVRPYWSLADAFGRRDARPREEAVAALRAELEDAARLHLVSDVPLGVFLSGGIDSSALVGLVSHVDRPPHTVSVQFGYASHDERPYIDFVQRRFGTEHTAIEVDDATILSEVPAAIAAMDQPTVDGVNTFVVSRLAREAGLTVALSGLGGDELFGGYDTFRFVPQLDAVRRVPAPLSRAAAAALGRLGTSDDRRKKMIRWLARSDGDLPAYALRREIFSPAATEALAGSAPDWSLPDGVSDRVNAVSLLELDVYMRNVLLRDSDALSMAHSLEVRVPFLDHRVVELAASLDGRWKKPGDTPKALLVDALHDLLPREIVYRRKMGFAFPFAEWLRTSLREEAEEVLLDRDHGGAVGAMLDPAAVEDTWRAFLAGETYWVRPWALFVAKRWGERHATRGAAAAAA